MEFAFLKGGKPPDLSELITPVGAELRSRSFIMLTYLFVSLGGAIGTAARYWLSGFIAERGGEIFPVGHTDRECQRFFRHRNFRNTDRTRRPLAR